MVVLTLDGACDDERAGRAVERMWETIFVIHMSSWSIIPIVYLYLNHNLVFYVFHLLFLRYCMGQMP